MIPGRRADLARSRNEVTELLGWGLCLRAKQDIERHNVLVMPFWRRFRGGKLCARELARVEDWDNRGSSMIDRLREEQIGFVSTYAARDSAKQKIWVGL